MECGVDGAGWGEFALDEMECVGDEWCGFEVAVGYEPFFEIAPAETTVNSSDGDVRCVWSVR